jgi:hypothetical protein
MPTAAAATAAIRPATMRTSSSKSKDHKEAQSERHIINMHRQ